MQVMYSFQKNRTEHVKAYFQTFKRTDLVHLRVFQAGADGTQQPTKKGIAVRVDQLADLHAAIEALVAANEAESR